MDSYLVLCGADSPLFESLLNLPCLGTQSPRGIWPFSESGTPITAASAI